MAKQRATKAEQILRELVDTAHNKVVALQGELDVAMATHNAHFEALARLQQARQVKPATKPAKATKKPSTGQAAAKEPTADKDVGVPGLCAFKSKSGHVCLAPPSNAIHDATFGYAGYHEFVAAKPARKPRAKKETPASTQSSEIETVAATSAAHAASAGD